ncbi:hypothetical protein I7I53_02114 [Histoplasma capsulatum var. duboisii H88]|uniref:Uncharacterized protein n=1 Tax=Ajellomyces capsulatus (strain H88) TaxID=544711 RepID=A0A8A1LM61_AJEC8|nr:hypothetical protein I7I53_02114 [Histoplasma capsulatum var. duboisii H88]
MISHLNISRFRQKLLLDSRIQLFQVKTLSRGIVRHSHQGRDLLKFWWAFELSWSLEAAPLVSGADGMQWRGRSHGYGNRLKGNG